MQAKLILLTNTYAGSVFNQTSYTNTKYAHDKLSYSL